ncbi:homeodomain transcription factor [Elysia marginata]|uniref:Homeodomain transcription factor n=1 Tax=Elysia marginata TaxID=1093978 RepID=A0AAV4I2Y6_9GAST|nr:homeodomain transcription factor [Elysia marginata]
MVPNSLGLRIQHEAVLKGQGHQGDKHVSSSENEGVGGQTPEGSHKAAVSSEEWEDRIQTDETTSSAYSSTCGDSEAESERARARSGHSFEDDGEEKTEYTTSTLHVINLLQPGGSPSNSGGNVTQSDRVSCLIWEGSECKKVDLTALDIGWAIIDKVDSLPESSDYFLIGLLFSVIIAMMPLVFRAWMNKDCLPWEEVVTISSLLSKLVEVPSLIAAVYTWRQWLLLVNSIMQRFCLSLIFFFLLSVADRTFKQRLLYAKHFSYLTSSRRARKFSMPHFRLNKVRNIKIWLSLRSYLKRRGPQRSVDVIVSACFMCAICTVSLISLQRRGPQRSVDVIVSACFMCAICTVSLISLQMLKDTENYLGYLCNWELLVWGCGLAIFLMRFMTVGLKINKKYRNLSVLITEQINLYLQMEQKPHKKDELILANNVLRLAEDLLKELESPFKISGFSANPVIYNITRVVVLSAFSAVLTEVLGFKLKLYKIKLKG